MYGNEWVIFLFGGIIVVIILGMSTFFLLKAMKRAKEIGIDKARIKTAITSSAIFSIVPSIPIVIGIGVMMPFLGLAIPWIRLTVIGALQYELIAMQQVTGDAAAGTMTASMIGTALVIMTISILAGPLFNAIAYKKYQTKLADLQQNNKKLLDTITGALLGGLLAGLASYIIAGGFFSIGATKELAEGEANGIVTLLTLAASAVIMLLCGVLKKVFKWKWLENYALPITIVGALGCAYGFSILF